MYYEALPIDSSKLSDLTNQDVKSLSEMPSIDSPATSLLPTNFTKYNASETLNSVSPSVFKYNLAANIEKIKPIIEQEVESKFSGLKGTTLPVANSVETDFLSLENDLQRTQNVLSTQSSQQILSINNTNQNAEFLGSVNNSYKTAIEKAATLSPKQIRDLNSTEIFEEKVSNTTVQALKQIETEVQKKVSELVQNTTLNGSGQTGLQQLSNPQFSGNNKNGFELFVLLSVYWSEGSGTDRDSAAKNSATGKRLSQGISAAVDPSVIPFSSKIEIEGVGIRYADDIGGAAKATTASIGTLPTVSIFYERKEDAITAAKSMKKTTTVRVYPPSSLYTYTKSVTPKYGEV